MIFKHKKWTNIIMGEFPRGRSSKMVPPPNLTSQEKENIGKKVGSRGEKKLIDSLAQILLYFPNILKKNIRYRIK